MTLGVSIDAAEVIVCVGTGGVGKTTTSAALALQLARRGRRVAVVTIDPAKRLADALGSGPLSNDPQQIDGDWPGELWALMLDTKRTFDDLVGSYAADDAQRERILENRFYTNVSQALSGTQEYMAMEKLYALRSDDRFDVVVVDTPPSRNALAFLDAPKLLQRLLDNWLYKALMAPSRGFMRALSSATQTVLSQLGRILSAEVVEDAVAFFQAFDGMEDGFRDRSEEVFRLLRAESTSFVLVATPRADTVAEATQFATQLEANDIRIRGLVVNRAQPVFAGLDSLLRSRKAALAPHRELAAQHRDVLDAEEQALAPLRAALTSVEEVRVPLAATDVHDLASLDALGQQLTG